MWKPSLAGFALLMLGMGQALACSCAALAPESLRTQADVILYGRVISVQRAGQGGAVRARIKVLRPVKGRTADVIQVETGPHSAACGVDMVPGRGAEYLLMRRNKRYSTNTCLMMGSKTR